MAVGRRRFDYLRGAEPYKYEWGAVDEPIERLLVVRRPKRANRDPAMASAAGGARGACPEPRRAMDPARLDIEIISLSHRPAVRRLRRSAAIVEVIDAPDDEAAGRESGTSWAAPRSPITTCSAPR